MRNEKPILLITTSDNRDELLKISEYLLKEKLIGCAQVLGPIISQYWWEGKIEKSQEYLLLIKTLSNKSEEVISNIEKLHSYSTPEIISINIDNVNKSYLNWLTSIVSGMDSLPGK